jgi:DNA-binding transcriptional MerR regulator
MAFTIKELESLSGIKAHTIRIWEQRYKFLKPDRTSTNIRTYSNEELKTLLTVALLNKYGYKISRIDEMPMEIRAKTVLNLNHEEAQTEYLVNDLIGHMIDLKANEFECVLNDYIHVHGLVATINVLIFPFLEKVGLLWQTNKLIPAQEHIVSNIIRQKLISAIDRLPPVNEPQSLFLLFLPEYEHHELGLLFVYYLLKKKSLPVLYLGANVPIKDVQYVVQVKKPHTLYLHLTSFPRQLQLEKYLNQLREKAGDAKILLSGNIVGMYQRLYPSNTTPLKSIKEVYSYINSLQ